MRLDLFLIKFKNVESRNKAQELIKSKKVFIKKQNQIIFLEKPSYEVNENEAKFIEIENSILNQYVSRAGVKLHQALIKLKFQVKDHITLDVGQSTGGFTDCLLQNGAQHVYGIDVGSGQLHAKFRSHKKVTFFENFNIRAPESQQNEFFLQIKDQISFVVCDVSFISLLKVIEPISSYTHANAHFLFLIKPQFECGEDSLDRHGIISDPSIYPKLLQTIQYQINKTFNSQSIYFESELIGKEGNQEFFIFGQKNSK